MSGPDGPGSAGATPALRLLRGGDLDPRWNMALDQALDPGLPALRLYRFSPPGLSLGYFQRAADFPEPWLEERGWVLVRRETGGAAICHQGDVTFSIVARPDHPIFAGDVEASYRRIHAAVTRGLARLGVSSAPRAGGGADSDRPGDDVVCFHRATRFDVVAAGRKLVGSAQRRTRARVLHHGSIPVRPNPLADAASSIDRLLGRVVPLDEVEDALIAGFESGLGVRLVPAAVTAEEARRAEELARTRFGADAWNRRR